MCKLKSVDCETGIRYKKGAVALMLAAAIAMFTAVSHLSCIVLGPSCYKAQMAPPEIVQSAIDGTWLAPVGTSMVAALFVLCGLYALSAAGRIRRLPLLKLGVYSIAGLCVVRGIATLPLSLMFPEMVSAFSIVAGAVWFITGLLFVFGAYRTLSIPADR